MQRGDPQEVTQGLEEVLSAWEATACEWRVGHQKENGAGIRTQPKVLGIGAEVRLLGHLRAPGCRGPSRTRSWGLWARRAGFLAWDIGRDLVLCSRAEVPRTVQQRGGLDGVLDPGGRNGNFWREVLCCLILNCLQHCDVNPSISANLWWILWNTKSFCEWSSGWIWGKGVTSTRGKEPDPQAQDGKMTHQLNKFLK